MTFEIPVFDRLTPTDWTHVQKYPIQLGDPETEPVGPMPVIVGTNIYDFMMRPKYDESDGRHWIGRNVTDWGPVRGGHCYVLKPSSMRDLIGWWVFYNQLREGKCCGFGGARAMSLVDRKKFDPHQLYYDAQKIDEWPGENYSGTSVNATVAVLRRDGAAVVRAGKVGPEKLEHGIKANRWAKTTEEIQACLQSPRLAEQGVLAYLQSWGPGHPHITYMPEEVMDRLMSEWGEATIFTPA